ncbi:G-type lectin S-receptor-like serine/threonine-protein kinase At2g19130 [Quercus lobata]|uniref:non-specific serine/threonine protein kinase n=1 Tax=Quercus lobata TaxID=97700 RepID=A0A7N2L3D4_QUELO|nr:G-type lectin S-receptor-like serine/threonine-protein kinase At2g19130 [Quercus lobata]
MEDSLDKLARKMNNRSMAQRSQKQEIYTTSKKAWSHFALLLILSLKAHLSTASASDTMYRGQPLAWNQTLTSKSGIFELGFFTPGKSHKYYVGIWYKTRAELRAVWVANRDCPVSDPSSKALEISEDGNLLITEKGIPFCKCTNSGMPNYTVAVLLDNGNFILRDKLDNVLWQSFEEQTNTLLPGAKIGYNTWTSSENPGSGQFSAELEQSGDAPVLHRSRTKMSKKAAWILGVLAMLILLLSIVLAIILCTPSADGALEESEFSLMLFKYRDLRKATNNFSQKLGEGGFGTVFKGTLLNSTAIAVKNIRSVEQGEKQFRAEVRTLGAIQHVNLLRLRGFCVEASKRFLVYDYMPKGSLESHLFKEVSKILDWNTRYHIAIGIARGLAYLHETCIDCIIHCDIKPENILLDAEYDPKVADFGLAKVIGRNFSRVLITMRGTRGYLAPEWISGEAVTSKVDVFSYGKLLFEIISGRRNINMVDEEICNYFPARVAMAINKGEDLLTLLDLKLEGNANMEELTRACKVACWCIQDDPSDRPTMGNVVKILEGLMQLGIPQIPLYFRRLSENPMEASVCHEIETCSSSY